MTLPSRITVLICFFSAEEYHLVRFFGDEYKEYRRRVGTKIPFVP
jgi:protein-S-isoprenylcysteine O-methyltransferase Ste14